MSETPNSPDPDVSLLNQLDAATDPLDVALTDIHGLDEQVERIREAFLPTITAPQVAVYTPSILFHGPTGAGQHRVAQGVAGELATHDFDTIHVSPSKLDTVSADQQHHQRSGELLAQLIDDLRRTEPATLLIEDFEEFHINTGGEFHTAIADLRDTTDQVAVLCVLTRDTPHIDRQRTPEYYEFADFYIHVPSPDDERRAHVLQATLEQLTADTPITVDATLDPPLPFESNLGLSHLDDVARRAVTLAQARTAETPELTTSDITTAITHLSAELANAAASSDDVQSEFQPTVPTVTFDDIGGLDTVKQRLTELVTYPQQYDELYAQSSLTPANGVLLCGPPGTGKTLLAKALATETDRTFYAVDGAEIKSKWFGQSEQRLQRLFTTARDTAPSIIFFDEFDALAGTRHDATHSTVQSIVNTLLAELDGITENDELLVVAATNYPDAIDPAITRPGRLGETLDVPEPDDAAIREIFQIHTRDLPTADNVTAAWFATTAPDGITGATIADLTEQALHYAIRDAESDSESETPTITRHHLNHAINQTTGQNNEVNYGYHYQ